MRTYRIGNWKSVEAAQRVLDVLDASDGAYGVVLGPPFIARSECRECNASFRIKPPKSRAFCCGKCSITWHQRRTRERKLGRAVKKRPRRVTK